MTGDAWQDSRYAQFESQDYADESETSNVFGLEKKQVLASETPNFGDRTLIGLGLIIFTLICQFLRMTLGSISGSDDVTLEDIESSIKTAYYFELIFIIIQLIGVSLIYRDVKDLSDYMRYDTEVRNQNLVTIIKKVNKKNQ